MYESILREATSFADKDVLLAITLSNMGSIYYKRQISASEKYYLDSLQLQKQIDLNYLDTIYEMALVCIKLEELEEARTLIDKGIDADKTGREI